MTGRYARPKRRFRWLRTRQHQWVRLDELTWRWSR
jgi:hypothetical protein